MIPTWYTETGPRGGLRYILSTEHGQFHGNSKAEARAQALKAKRPGVTVEQYRALLVAVDAARRKFLPVDGVARETINQRPDRERSALFEAWPGWEAARVVYLDAVNRAERAYWKLSLADREALEADTGAVDAENECEITRQAEAFYRPQSSVTFGKAKRARMTARHLGPTEG